jgi:hypothetical protein
MPAEPDHLDVVWTTAGAPQRWERYCDEDGMQTWSSTFATATWNALVSGFGPVFDVHPDLAEADRLRAENARRRAKSADVAARVADDLSNAAELSEHDVDDTERETSMSERIRNLAAAVAELLDDAEEDR